MQAAEVVRAWGRLRGGMAALLLCLLCNGYAIDTVRVAERRVALVIGNGAYSGAERLETPRQDAADVSAALARLGFSVISPPPRDLDQRGMEQVVQKFSEASRDADVALFYYAGHGVGRGGDNWLIPVGTEIADPADLRYRAVSLRWIADRLKASGARARILIVDACRNNRWYEADRGPGQRGLERITPPSGTLIAYAAAPGEVARDKHPSRPNGLYTGELVQALAQEPEVEIRELIRRVGARVNRLNANQNPSTEEIGFYASLHLGEDPRADEEAFWQQARQSTTKPGYEAYLARYPNGRYTERAQQGIATLARPVQPSSQTSPAPLTSGGEARSLNTAQDDGVIEREVKRTIEDRLGTRIGIDVVVLNRKVLLLGKALNEEVKAEAERLAARTNRVEGLYNEIAIGDPKSRTISADSYRTLTVKVRLTDSQDVSTHAVKVVTEDDVVYLMGLVTQREADAAIQVARTTASVRKVVGLFEIISERARGLVPSTQ